jgi:tetratricopeptide (TPR) repeat protein
MNFKSEKEKIKSMIENIDDKKLKEKISKALTYIDDSKRALIITFGIDLAKKSGYFDLAKILSNLSVNIQPGNSILFLKYLEFLKDNKKKIEEIENFLKHNKNTTIAEDQLEKLNTNLSIAYKELNKYDKAIEILERTDKEAILGIEILAELYFKTGKTEKTIKFLFDRLKFSGKLSPIMGEIMQNSFDKLKNYSDAVNMLYKFKDDASILPLFEYVKEKSE